MTSPTISERLDDLVRLEALVENTCTCGRGTDRAAHETPCPFAPQTRHLPEIPDDYQPQAYREGRHAPNPAPVRVDPAWLDDLARYSVVEDAEISCGHEPRRPASCPRCRSALADAQLEARR